MTDPAPRGGKRILVVDDRPDSAETLQILLRLLGHDVRAAHDGADAIAAATDFAPQIVLLDIGLPGMDGFEVCRALRRLPFPERPVLVACTGWAGEADRRRTEEAGFDFHLAKPIDPEALEKLLAELGES